jgi:TonB-dependent starch-binding outer membrane protein SusC
MNQSCTQRMVTWLLLACLSVSLVLSSPVPAWAAAFAQADQKVSGRVTDENGDGMPGVNVSIKGTTKGVMTDAAGVYSLQVADGAVLVFSFVGYATQEMTVGNKTTLNVQLKPDAKALDEVVVVGYGQVRKSDLTGSVASVSAKEIKAFPTASVDQALSARATGVNVTQASGAPNGGVTVRVRGSNSILAGSEPLYVIDGIPVYSDNDAYSTGGNRVAGNALASINPNDIESVEVLKDASGTSIYGSRGANGVILITTKRGKAGSTKIDYEGAHGFQSPAKKLEMLNATEFAQYQNLRALSRNQTAPFPNPTSLGTGVNWQDETMRTGSVMNHQLTFSGGSEKTTFATSINYFKNNGIVKNTDFERFSLRVNLDSKFLNDKVRVGTSTMIARTNSNSIPTDRGGPGGAIITILGQSPVGTVFNQDGSYRLEPYDGRFLTNPLAEAMEVLDIDRATRILSNNYVQVEILKNLSFKTSLGVDLYSGNRETYYSRETRIGRERNRSYELASRNIVNLLNENILNFSKKINDNNRIDALVGYTYQQDDNRGFFAQTNNFTLDNYDVNNIQNGVTLITPSSGRGWWTLQSLLARVNYNLMDKYLLTLTVRRDGSSKFGANNKWANFPSAAFAWRMKEEEFLKNNTLISDAKMRVSYGITGNSQIPLGRSLAALAAANYLVDGSLVAGIRESRVPNPDLKWETTSMFDIGFDFGLFNNRLQLTMDYFSNQTSDLLLEVALPTSTGFTSALKNSGTLKNTGFELMAKYAAVNTSSLRWDLTLNASTQRNEVVDLAGTPSFYSFVGSHLGPEGSYVTVGQPLGGWYGYQYLGIWQSADQIRTSPSIEGIDKPGYPRYADVNGDGKIDTGDRTYLGDPNPRFIWGLNSDMQIGNFDFAVFIRGAHGHKIRNLQASEHADGVGNYNQYATALRDAWSPTNTGGTRPIVDANREFPTFFRRSNFFIEDGSFVRLQNVSLGYRFKNLKHLRNARVYMSAQNLFVITKYTGFDPEVSNGGQSALNRGDDYDAYPRPRTITFGVQLGF